MTFGIWQVVWLCLMVVGLVGAILKHGESRPPFNAGTTLIATLIEVAILWAGGFFG